MVNVHKQDSSKRANATKDAVNEFTSPGMRIKKIRVENSMTQQQFADVLNELTGTTTILKGSVNNWEHDRNLPNKKRLGAIAHLGNTSVSSIVSGRSFGEKILITDDKINTIKKKVQETLQSQGDTQLQKKDEQLINSFIELINALHVTNKTSASGDLEKIIVELTNLANHRVPPVNIQRLTIKFIQLMEILKIPR